MFDSGEHLALSASSTLIALPAGTRRVRLVNVGPNAVYVGPTAAKATVAAGMPMVATTATLIGFLEIDILGHDIYIRAATADQVGGAGTRWYALG